MGTRQRFGTACRRSGILLASRLQTHAGVLHRRSSTRDITVDYSPYIAFRSRCVLLGFIATPAFANVLTTWTLAGGVMMPVLALNTAGMTASDSTRATLEALDAGITHVDFHPGIERDGVAAALKSSKRDLFLTTKIAKPPVRTTPEKAREVPTAIRTET
jgi:hypothetical protein